MMSVCGRAHILLMMGSVIVIQVTIGVRVDVVVREVHGLLGHPIRGRKVGRLEIRGGSVTQTMGGSKTGGG